MALKLCTSMEFCQLLIVQFQSNDELPNFVEIQYFVKNENVGYAVVNVLRNAQVNICENGLAAPTDPVVKEFLTAKVLGFHFISMQRTRTYKLIRCDQITARAIFIDSTDAHVDGYISTVLKSYQHDQLKKQQLKVGDMVTGFF